MRTLPNCAARCRRNRRSWPNYGRRVNSIPEIEAELSRLNRDYEVNKQQYDTLLQRLESAKISQSADQNTENVKFRIIEPPTVPVKAKRPAAPDAQ